MTFSQAQCEFKWAVISHIMCNRMWSYLIFVISFTQVGFSNSKFFTQKYHKFTPKRVKHIVFLRSIWKKFTTDRIFLHGQRPWCSWQISGMDVMLHLKIHLNFWYRITCLEVGGGAMVCHIPQWQLWHFVTFKRVDWQTVLGGWTSKNWYLFGNNKKHHKNCKIALVGQRKGLASCGC